MNYAKQMLLNILNFNLFFYFFHFTPRSNAEFSHFISVKQTNNLICFSKLLRHAPSKEQMPNTFSNLVSHPIASQRARKKKWAKKTFTYLSHSIVYFFNTFTWLLAFVFCSFSTIHSIEHNYKLKDYNI